MSKQKLLSFLVIFVLTMSTVGFATVVLAQDPTNEPAPVEESAEKETTTSEESAAKPDEKLVVKPPTINSFDADPITVTIEAGAVATSTLSWDVTGAVTTTLNGEVVVGTEQVVEVTETTTFILAAENEAGAVDEQIVVSVEESAAKPDEKPEVEPPTINSFVADPTAVTIEAGAVATSTLSWDVTGAITTTLNGEVVAGTEQVVEVTETTTFILAAENEAGAVDEQIVVSVEESAAKPDEKPEVEPPTINSFVAAPSAVTIEAGAVATSTLSWDVTGAITTTLNGEVVAGTEQVVEVTETTTFILAAENEAGAVDEQIVVSVEESAAKPDEKPEVEPPTINSFVAAPSAVTIEAGAVATSTLSWDVTGAVTTTLDGEVVAGTDQVVEVTETTTFTLAAENEAGVVEAQTVVTIEVVEPELEAGDISAQATAKYSTEIAVMDASGAANQISVAYYEQDGTAINSNGYNTPVNFSAHESMRIQTSDINTSDPSFIGSAVLQGTGKVAAVVRIDDVANTTYMDMYSGADTAQSGTNLIFPVVHRNGTWYANIFVQNIDTTQTADVTINFRTRGSSIVIYSEDVSIDPQASVNFDLLDSKFEAINTGAGITKWVGWAEIVSNNDVPLIGREIQNNVKSNQKAVHESFLENEKGTKFYMPLVHAQAKSKGGNGWQGFVVLMNLSGSPIDIDIEFIDNNGASEGTYTVSQLGSFDIVEVQGDVLSNIANDSSWKGSAIATSTDGDFIAEVTNAKFTATEQMYYLYKAFKDGGTATELFFPYNANESNGDRAWNVAQNVGSSATDITFYYYNLDGSQAVAPQTISDIGVGANVEIGTHTVTGLSDFTGSVRVTSTGGQPIEGYSTVCDLTNNWGAGDVCGTYTAFK